MPSRAERVVDRLGALYEDGLDAADFMLFTPTVASLQRNDSVKSDWQKTYGGRDAFECLVRTVLSQNTSDKASHPAHVALMERYAESDGEACGAETRNADLAVALANADPAKLADTIRPAGLYNQKADVLVAVAERILDAHGSAAAFDRFVREGEPAEVRSALLDLKGVGPKTADCVLLFAGGRAGVFPVDTHVHRIYRRLGIAPPTADHEGVRAVLERDVPGEKCGFGHTASIQFGREYCTARKPVCLEGLEKCPLSDVCDRVGVDVETGKVTDPADAGAE